MRTLLVVLASFGYSVLGAIIPVFNTEVYAAAVPTASHVSPVLVALALALGQVLGKMPYWLAGRGADRWSSLRERSHRPRRWKAPEFLRRFGAWLRHLGEVISDWGRRGPWRMALVTFCSGLTGIPPFIVWPVAVGAIDPRWWRFFVPAMAGRTILYGAIALAPGVFTGFHLHL